MLGERADVHEAQDPLVQRKIHLALSRVAAKKLSRIEMQTLMTSVGLSAILYDPISTNAWLKTIRSAQRRPINISGRALGIRPKDRKFMVLEA